MSKDGKIRKDGYNMFIPETENPWQYCPYDDPAVYGYEHKQEVWKEGWDEAEKDFKEEEAAKEAEAEEFRAFACGCPWNSIDDTCMAQGVVLNYEPHGHEYDPCEKEACGLWYLKEFMS